MPVFVWMTLVTSFLIIFAMPVIAVALFELMFDRLFDANFFNAAKGGTPLLWQHMFWLFGHPEVYILILPAMGIVSEVLPTFSREAAVRLPVRRVLRRRDRLHELGRLGAPHVHDGPRLRRELGVRHHDDHDRGADGREDLQLDGDAVGRLDRASRRRSTSPSASSRCSRSAA